MITFLANCAVIYFFVVLPMNNLLERVKKAEAVPDNPSAAPAAPDTRTCPE
jgi:hypothetical protein